MAKLISVFSMLSNDQSFPIYAKKEGEAAKKSVSVNNHNSAILIKGGANVADKNRSTSKFVETKVEEADFKLLEASPVFSRMIKRGFITLETPKEFKKDKAAPLTEKEIKAKNAKVKVVTNEQKPE